MKPKPTINTEKTRQQRRLTCCAQCGGVSIFFFVLNLHLLLFALGWKLWLGLGVKHNDTRTTPPSSAASSSRPCRHAAKRVAKVSQPLYKCSLKMHTERKKYRNPLALHMHPPIIEDYLRTHHTPFDAFCI